MGCNNPGKNLLEILFINKSGWFCDSCRDDLVNLELVKGGRFDMTINHSEIDYWFYTIGANVIPVDSKNKIPTTDWKFGKINPYLTTFLNGGKRGTLR